jgi:hypothetical protein
MKRYFWLMFFLLITFAWCQKENVTVEGDIWNTGFVFSWLEFDATNFEIKTLSLSWEDFQVRAYEWIVYVKNPVVEDYQKMNIYVPENYFSWEKINGFSLETAPIFFPNKVWWYMPAKPETLWGSEEASYGDFLEAIKSSWEQPQWKNGDLWEKWFPWKWDGKWMMRWWFWWNKDSVSLYALKEGFVVASAWARGRSLQDWSWKYVWKAPAWIIDLKAAIRYLKYNDALIPGDSNKIISNWTSAGWAMSALLWSTANHPDYESYLEEIWAAPATDDVFAVSTYCPITNLDNADKAYEWEFKGVDSYNKISANQLDYNEDRSETESGAISNSENEIAKLLRDSFPFYLSTLWLVDTNWNIYSLNEDWEWNFKESIKMMLVDSFNEALKSWENLSWFDWLSIENWEVVSIDFESYVKNYLTRNKWIPAFDGLSLEAWENNLFWDAAIDNRHFTNFSFEHSLVSWDIASNDIVKLMNPMNYIPDSQADVSKFRRIRHWAKDADTSLAIPFILSEALTQWRGANVDFKYPWNQWHGWDYDIPQLIAWMNSITH